MELDCGIGRDRIEAWLGDELALGRDDAGWRFDFGGASCIAATSALPPRPFGQLELERTSLRFEGDAAAVDELHRLFILRFASAGG